MSYKRRKLWRYKIRWLRRSWCIFLVQAIHEGNGTIQLYITKNALKDNSVRDALVDVFSGKAKGEGPFALFAGTFKYFLEPQFVDINVKVDGKEIV